MIFKISIEDQPFTVSEAGFLRVYMEDEKGEFFYDHIIRPEDMGKVILEGLVKIKSFNARSKLQVVK